MNFVVENFIGVFDNVYEEGFCNHLIQEFNRLEEDKVGFSRLDEGAQKHVKDDYHIYVNLMNEGIKSFGDKNSKDLFFNGLQRCYDEYVKKFSVLSTCKLHCSNIKMQKTVSGGGYHVWHHEQGNDETSSRGLVYILYLNDLPPENCGETEFMYQEKRYSPTVNRMIIWPAGFTHPHRGNPVYGGIAKYIATGWFTYE